MRKKIWTKEKLDVLSLYLDTGASYKVIADKMGVTYDAMEKAIRRYGLKANIDTTLVLPKDKSKLKKDDVTRLSCLIGQNLYDNYRKVALREPKALKGKAKREEESILDLSDIHMGTINEVFDSKTGKKELTYNMNIFKQEMANLQESIFQIHEILRNAYSLKKLNIFLLGDIITNDRIFPEQTFEIEKVVGLQIWDGISYLTKFINNMLKIYEKITVVGVVGNHGRSNPTHYNEPVQNNFEFFIYKTLQKQFADSKRVTIIVPETRRYIHTVCGWRHLIEHGDSMRGSSANYIEKQIKDLKLNIGGFDVLHFGHFHKLNEIEISENIIVKQNGCWIPKDNYGFNKFKNYSIPKQHFFGCNAKRPETWSYKIDLRIGQRDSK